MSVKHCFGKGRPALAALVAAIFVATGAIADAQPTAEPMQRTVRPAMAPAKKPLARLVKNPDSSNGQPPYALADQTGRIQRYVEPVPGIDLEPYVGYAVMVKHDTGRTLLASQLELPGPNSDPSPESVSMDRSASSGAPPSAIDGLFKGILDSPNGQSNQFNQPGQLGMPNSPYAVQPAQYAQGMPNSSAPVMIQDGGPPMMDSQGVTSFDPGDPGMQGMPPGAVYLDGPPGSCGCPPCQGSCGTCPTCPTCPQPCMQPMMQCQPQPVPCQPMVPVQQQVVCQPQQPFSKWAMWGDALWIRPTGIDMAYAQQQNGIGGAGTVPFGTIGVLQPDFDLGFRVGGECRYNPCESLFVTYTFFETNASDHLDAPVIGGGGGAVGSLVQHPGAALTASAGPVDATYDIRFQMGDFAYRYFIASSPTGAASVFAGGRFGELKQNFGSSGNFGGGQGGDIDVTSNINFDGAGPMVGITGEHLIDCTRFSVYGRGSIAAMTGEFRTNYQEFKQTTQSPLAIVDWKDNRIVPMLDYEVGVAWTGPNNHLRLAAGYMVQAWFNAVTTPVFIDAVQADNYVNVKDTITFDGAVGRVECIW